MTLYYPTSLFLMYDTPPVCSKPLPCWVTERIYRKSGYHYHYVLKWLIPLPCHCSLPSMQPLEMSSHKIFNVTFNVWNVPVTILNALKICWIYIKIVGRHDSARRSCIAACAVQILVVFVALCKRDVGRKWWYPIRAFRKIRPFSKFLAS